MANRRMFSKTITSSSSFLMMPPTSRLLYYDLGMNADDDGFCEHFTIMRMTEASPDDLRVLEARGFVKVFDDKVLVIRNWKENNYIQSDRYTPSKYLEIYKKELKLLARPSHNECIQDVSISDTQDRLGKDRIGKDILTTKVVRAKAQPREDINILLNGIRELVGVIDGSKQEQRNFAKNFIDSKTPEILRRAGNPNPTKQQVINATLRIFQLATKDNFHRKNCNSLKYVYNKAAGIALSEKTNKPKIAIISNE